MECAGRQGQFWQMHDILLQPKRPKDTVGLGKAAAALKVDVAAVNDCLANPPPKVLRVQALATELGINGTPTFVVGTAEPDGTIRPRFKLVGSPSDARMAAIIKTLSGN